MAAKLNYTRQYSPDRKFSILEEMCDIIIHDARNNPQPIVVSTDPLMKMIKRVSEVATNLAYMDE